MLMIWVEGIPISVRSTDDVYEHYRGEDLALYAYCAKIGRWSRWAGRPHVWDRLPSVPPTLVYRIYDEEREFALRATQTCINGVWI
jgi:hypothetical protein